MPRSRNQIQELLSMRGTPARLAENQQRLSPGRCGTATGGSQSGKLARCGGGAPDKSRGGGARRETRHIQEQRPHIQHKTKQCTKQQQVPSPSVSSGVEHAKRLPIPPSRRRFRCPKSEGRPDTHFADARYCGVPGRMPKLQGRWILPQRTIQTSSCGQSSERISSWKCHSKSQWMQRCDISR